MWLCCLIVFWLMIEDLSFWYTFYLVLLSGILYKFLEIFTVVVLSLEFYFKGEKKRLFIDIFKEEMRHLREGY